MYKNIKKLIVITLVVFSLVENICATSLSNNDGSAFITKAEFDALKSSFQSQIDTYNQGIDSKIDGAIASYLSGIKINTEIKQANIYNTIGKTLKFGNIPIASTNIKYQIFQSASLLGQGDGYDDTGVRIKVRYFYGSNNWIGGTSDASSTGTYNIFQDINGYRCFYGKTVGEYCKTAYSFSGDVMVPKAVAGSATIPGGANTVGGSKVNGTDDKTKLFWNAATDINEWYKYDPATGGWGDKMTYFTRIDSYVNGTLTSYSDLMASGAVTTSYYNMIDFDHREQCAEDKVLTRTSAWTANSVIMSQGLGLTGFSLNAPLKYYWPKLTDYVYFDDLNNLTIAQALNIGMPLYGGVPLFKATDDGTVTFTFKMNTTNTSAAPQAYFALVDGGINGDRCFANADTFSVGGGDVGFDAWDVMPDGTEHRIGTGINSYVYSYVNDGRKLKVQFKTKKGHTYVFKMKPSALTSGSTNIYAYASDFGDIIVKRDNN